jgi:hypothetical protein
MHLTTASEAASVVLRATLREPSLADSTIVRRAWIQTWILDSHRRDRAVFQVLTGDPQLRVNLPREADRDPEVLDVAIDGRRVEPLANSPPGSVILNLEAAPAKTLRQHVVELWYAFDTNSPRRGRMQLQCARIEGVDQTVQSYWQLILPMDELLVWADPRLAMDWSWAWQWLGWQRAPRWNQAELEDWIRASRQEPVPQATSRYLFSTFGAPRRLEVVSVIRSAVVLVISGLALFTGLLIVYFRRMRHPAALIAVAVVVLACALLNPELAILVAQAGSLGAVLVALAPLLRAAVRRHQPAATAPPGRSRSADSRMLEAQFSHAEGSSRVPAAAGSASAAPVTPEPEP